MTNCFRELYDIPLYIRLFAVLNDIGVCVLISIGVRTVSNLESLQMNDIRE